MTDDKNLKQSIYLPTSILQDSSKEPLTIILKPYKGLTHIPSELGNRDVVTLVFVELNKCFEKAGYVAEGMLSNIIWGFEQCGYDPRAVAAGLTKLRSLGYITYTDDRKNPIHETDFDPKKPIWIRYASKFTDLFVKELITTTSL